MTQTTFTLTVDGGCTNNQVSSKALGYYSMKLVDNETSREREMLVDGVRQPISRHVLNPFFRQTNQVAELVVLIKAVNYLLELAARCQASKQALPIITIHTDSKYAHGWAAGVNRKAGVNVELTSELRFVARQLEAYPEFSISRVDRSVIVGVLGH